MRTEDLDSRVSSNHGDRFASSVNLSCINLSDTIVTECLEIESFPIVNTSEQVDIIIYFGVAVKVLGQKTRKL